jgi:hypothetical protein
LDAIVHQHLIFMVVFFCCCLKKNVVELPAIQHYSSYSLDT